MRPTDWGDRHGVCNHPHYADNDQSGSRLGGQFDRPDHSDDDITDCHDRTSVDQQRSSADLFDKVEARQNGADQDAKDDEIRLERVFNASKTEKVDCQAKESPSDWVYILDPRKRLLTSVTEDKRATNEILW